MMVDDGGDGGGEGSGSARVHAEDVEEDDDDWISRMTASHNVAQIGLDEDGNIAPDELQMEIEGPEEFREENYEEVFERESDRFVNSLSHSKKHKGSARWTQAETAIFFHVSFPPINTKQLALTSV